MTVRYFLNKLRDVKIKDYLSAVKLLIALLLKCIVGKRYSQCWVVCETSSEARDNGYHFFKYVRKNNPSSKCYYAINKYSPDFKRVEPYGNVISYGSIFHWLLYLCAEYNISSQKGGKPNAAVCAFLELTNLIDSRFVFLQHGVTINNVIWAHEDVTKLRYFITSTIPETKFIRENFGFDYNKIVLTGMPRFDNLHDNISEENYILIMPTWRGRFTLNSEKQAKDNNFEKSVYKKSWEELLNNLYFEKLIEDNDLKVIFFPHRNIQRFLSDFNITNKRITIANWENYDIQEEIKKASLMITDYSSVFFDMVYMKKPIIFYQFDYEDFRKFDYSEGYFDYRNNPFGEWCETGEEVIDMLKKQIEKNFRPSESFLEEHKHIFPFCDSNNSKRIVDLLSKKGM